MPRTNNSHLMLIREMIDLHYLNHTEHIHTVIREPADIDLSTYTCILVYVVNCVF
jgi:hypothetical protein